MSQQLEPFNLWLLEGNTNLVKGLRPVRVADTFDASGAVFHEDGLFSTEIFGPLGAEARDNKFSFIDLKVPILHPELCITLRTLKSLYGGIMSGKRTALWDDSIKDFVASNDDQASTGYTFFLKHLRDIKFERNQSEERSLRIGLLEKYLDKGLMTKHLVMPAGLRDIYVGPNGQHSEDEVNDLYRKLLSTSRTVAEISQVDTGANLDAARWSMQLTSIGIYTYIKQILSGKRGWIQQKYGSRKTRHGTRNVITSMSTATMILGAANALSVTNTEMGLLQALRGALPKTIHSLKAGIVGATFGTNENEVWLVNPKTLKAELVHLPTDEADNYTSKSGLDKFVSRFFVKEFRNRPVEVEGYYLGLLYVDDKHFKIMRSIDELPEGFDPANVSPLKLSDVLHLSCYMAFKKLGGTITRYPITGAGSIYPTIYKVRTTTDSTSKLPLDDDWQPMAEEYRCYDFHNRAEDAHWLDSLCPHPTRLRDLGADFDGDMVSSPICLSDEAWRAIVDYYNKKSSFVGANGKLITSVAVDTVSLALNNMTGDPIN